MANIKLTKSVVESLSAPIRNKKFVFDTAIPGFGVAVYPSGIKTFVYQDRIDGKKRRITIGRFGKITVEAARNQAKTLAGEIARGGNPIAQKHRKKAEAITLKESLSEYLENRELKESTREDIEKAMKKFDDWLNKPIVDISREMVTKRHKKLGENSHAQANLAMRYLRAVLNYAKEAHAYPDGTPLLPHNPVDGLSATKSWFKVPRRRRFLQEHEIKPWMEAVMDLPYPSSKKDEEGKRHAKMRNKALARDFYLLLILTGLRKTEASELKWEYVDFKGKTLTIPDPKNYEPHTLPLSDYLYSILTERRKSSGEVYVFSGTDGKRYQNFRHAQSRIAELSGINFTPHDLRRTFATIAESLNIPAYSVKGLLNHKTSGDITAGYIQITVDRLREPMQKITDYILIKGGIRGNKILPFDKAAGN